MPAISIITPTYTGSRYLPETIKSVKQQTFSDREHIIINDNSPEDIDALILPYQKEDARIRYSKNTKNLGIAGSRNAGIALAQGKYLCFLDHDDLFIDTEKLQKQYDFLEAHPGYALVSSLVTTIDGDGNTLYNNPARETDADIRAHFLQSNQFLPCAVMVCKDCVVEAGGFDSTYDKSDDYDLRMKIGRYHKLHCLQEYMAGYRVHGANASGSTKALYHMRHLARRIFRKNRSYYPNVGKALLLRIGEYILPPSRVASILSLFKKTK